jgi:ligand-binding sensor domain-containing protein
VVYFGPNAGHLISPRLITPVDPTNPALIYAGSLQSWYGHSSGVYVSRDRGETWTNINANLGSALTVWGISVSSHYGMVWLATDYGNWRLHTTQTIEW